MNKIGKKTVIAIILANCFLILAAICGKILSRFDYEDHLDEAVITVDDASITLREFGYYIYEVEAFVQNQALLYDPENPKLWWNTHFSAGLDSQFVCDYAKKVAINTCVSDEIYYRLALKQGISLSIDETEQAAIDAAKMFGGMDPEQLKATGLDEKMIRKIKEKHALAAKYAIFLITSQNLSGYHDDPQKLVNWDGAYYQEKILPEHQVRNNDDVLDNITLGKITVNME